MHSTCTYAKQCLIVSLVFARSPWWLVLREIFDVVYIEYFLYQMYVIFVAKAPAKCCSVCVHLS